MEGLDSDIAVSIALGGILAGLFIAKGNYLYKKFSSAPSNGSSSSPPQKPKVMHTGSVSKLSKVLGIPEDNVRDAIKEEKVTRHQQKAQEVLGMTDEQVKESAHQLVENLAIKKSNKIAKVLGMSEEDLRNAIRDRPAAVAVTAADEGIDWIKLVDRGILVALIVTFLYFANKSSNGDLGRLLAALFPREMEALGLKNKLEALADHAASSSSSSSSSSPSN